MLSVSSFFLTRLSTLQEKLHTDISENSTGQRVRKINSANSWGGLFLSLLCFAVLWLAIF